MLKIRLQRVGRRNNPSFRVVCTDSKRGPKSGNNIEILGSYDPKPNNFAIKGDRVEYWISQGAQISDTVNNLLVKEGVIKAKKKHVSRGKKNTRTPEAEVEESSKTAEEASSENAEAVEVLAKETSTPIEENEKKVSAEDVPTEEVVEEKKEVV